MLNAKCDRVASRRHRLWVFSSFVGIATLYLCLVWKTTLNIDRLTTDALFWGAILWLLWQKKERLSFNSDPISSFSGLSSLGLIFAKVITLYSFESDLLALFPFFSAIALVLIVSGISNCGQYLQELFFTWFLFFPTGVIGHFIDNTIHITILNAKLATYLLYYFGFDVVSNSNQVILTLPEVGKFKAIVDYPCAGVPMILLILKLALLFIAAVSLTKKQRLLVPIFSVALGFLLGVVRVCVLTLLIPQPTQFGYWHGAGGSQIFSTLAIIIFSAFCYWILYGKENIKKVSASN